MPARLILLLCAAILLHGLLPVSGPAFASESFRSKPKIEVVQVAAPDSSNRHLRVRLLLPSGDGPFPLVVINHGSPANRERRLAMGDPEFRQLSDWFLDRGYAVALPLRRGYGATGGKWNESYGSCNNPHYAQAGLESAKDIKAVIENLHQRDDIAGNDTVVIGQSAGGWGTLAVASLNLPGVSAYINFSGGRGGHIEDMPDLNCNGDRLVDAARQYGRTVHKPTLWLYAENDPFFPPDLVRRMYAAFIESGNGAALNMLPPFEDNGHHLSADGEMIWAPILSKFLDSQSLSGKVEAGFPEKTNENKESESLSGSE